MKQKQQHSKEPATPNVRVELSSFNREKNPDPSSTSAGGNKRFQRSTKLREQKESLKNSK